MDEPGATRGGDSSGAIELRAEGVSKAFGDNQVLREIDLEVERGGLVAIVGGSGCGKTVLLEVLTGQLAPDTGRVLVTNHERPGAPLVDLGGLDEDGLTEIRTHWAIVFQRNALFSGTVRDNLGLWQREVKRLDEAKVERRSRSALEAVELVPDDVLDLDRAELSGGMAKRVALARALALEPILVFYDEPTTGLDPLNASAIHELIYRVHVESAPGGEVRTTVIITHDRDLLRRLQPRVVMLHAGRVSFDGSYEAFSRSESEVVRPYFQAMPVLNERPTPRG